jgi:hypothetical protein
VQKSTKASACRQVRRVLSIPAPEGSNSPAPRRQPLQSPKKYGSEQSVPHFHVLGSHRSPQLQEDGNAIWKMESSRSATLMASFTWAQGRKIVSTDGSDPSRT